MERPFPARPNQTRYGTETKRLCDHPDCMEPGEHKAPMAKDRLRDYFWFCLTHVREYNAAWNYCADMSAEEIDGLIREDVTWGRPTWPMGMMGAKRAYEDQIFDDPLGAFEGAFDDAFDGRSNQSRSSKGSDGNPRNGSAEARYYRIMHLRPPVTLTALKARYKELAKRLHPDVNGGDKDAEDRLKEINEAYTVLKKHAVQSE